ncbi:MAG: iron complex outermembrane receptor protein, partial [Pseudohongiellaceae bacterium]
MNKNFSAPFRFINLGYFFTLVFHPIVYADTVLTYTPKPSNLEEVVVTSQRREQSLSSIPLAVSVINSQLITKASLNSLSEIASLIPNLQIAQPNGDVLPIFSIRGVSMADYSTNQSSPIGVYQDGVYLSANYMNGMTLFDLERVEVIKGPQGTLFGKNTTGGAIQLISKTPDFEADGNLKLSLGNYNAYELKAAYETPLIDQKLALRVAANIAKADGYSENHAPGQDDLSAVDRQAFKATLLYQANDDLEAVLRLYSSRSDANAPAVIPEASIATAFGNIDVASLVLAGASQPFYVRPASYDGHDADANKVGKMAIEKDGISLNVHWQQGNINFNSITGYYNGRYDLQADSDGTPLQVLELGYLSENKQFSQEFIISSEQSEPFGYIAGIYFSQDSVDTEVYYDFFHSWQTIAPAFNPGGALTTELPPSGLTQVQRYEQDRKSQALFGQINYDLSNALTITAGLRYTKDHGKQ